MVYNVHVVAIASKSFLEVRIKKRVKRNLVEILEGSASKIESI